VRSTLFPLLLLASCVLLSAGAPAEEDLPSPHSIVVPEGWEWEVVLAGVELPLGLKSLPDGSLLVATWGEVLRIPPVREDPWDVVAVGDFVAMFLEFGHDGTLYLASPTHISFGHAALWAVAPGEIEAQIVTFGLRYCEGVVCLPDGDLLAVDPGWIGTWKGDGVVWRVPPGTRDAPVGYMTSELENVLRNPIAIKFGPDGALYMLDRGRYVVEPGWMLRWFPGEHVAELFLEGLNDPRDFVWASDGSILMTERDYALDPSGTVHRWNPAIGEPWRIEIDAAGDIFVSDPAAGFVYRIYRIATSLSMRVQPSTLNLSSNGKDVMAHVPVSAVDPGSVALTAVDRVPIAPVPASRVWETGSGFHAKFPRSAVQAALAEGIREIRLEGTLLDGTSFVAFDTIRAVHAPGE
jgi:glucose/arabinose dehydrogenase